MLRATLSTSNASPSTLGHTYAVALGSVLWRTKSVFLVSGLFAAVMLYRVGFISDGGAVSGTDAGNWMALGHELTGQSVKAASTSYPPVVPALVKGLSLIFPPLVAITLVGAVATVFMGIPFFLFARQSSDSLWWGLLFTLGLLFVVTFIETLAWGGYPQLISQALMLFTLFWLGQGLVNARSRYLLWAAASAGLSVWTWIPSALLLAIATPLFFALIAVQRQLPIRDAAVGFGKWSVLALALSLGGLPFYRGAFEILRTGSWNPQGYGWGNLDTAFQTVFREWPEAVVSVAIVISIVSLLTLYSVYRGRRSLLASAAPALMVSSLLIFFATLEVRVLSLFAIGIVGAVAFLFSDLFSWLGNTPIYRPAVVVGRVALVAVALLVVLFQIGLGHQRSDAIFNYYRPIFPRWNPVLS